MELNPWLHMGEDDLKKFLTDPLNNENAPDREFVITFLRSLNRNFPSSFSDKRKLLDVGCGTGHMYQALKNSEMEFEYVGVDNTPNMVEFAQRRFSGVLSEAKFIQGDIRKLRFPSRSWPIVYVRHIFAHLPGYEVALAEVARVCSDCLIICLLKPLADKQEIKVIGKPPEQTKPGNFSEHFLNTYARKPFMEMLEKLGFNVVVDKLIEVGGFFKFYEVIIAKRMDPDKFWPLREPEEEQAEAEYEAECAAAEARAQE